MMSTDDENTDSYCTRNERHVMHGAGKLCIGLRLVVSCLEKTFLLNRTIRINNLTRLENF